MGRIQMKNVDELGEMIKEKEKELYELKKEYRERRTEGLRHAIEQKKEAERLEGMAEWKARVLGISQQDVL